MVSLDSLTDFGMARDVQLEDYYKKRGRGTKPVLREFLLCFVLQVQCPFVGWHLNRFVTAFLVTVPTFGNDYEWNRGVELGYSSGRTELFCGK